RLGRAEQVIVFDVDRGTDIVQLQRAEVLHAVADVVDVLAEGRVKDGDMVLGVGGIQALRVHSGGERLDVVNGNTRYFPQVQRRAGVAIALPLADEAVLDREVGRVARSGLRHTGQIGPAGDVAAVRRGEDTIVGRDGQGRLVEVERVRDACRRS